MAKGHVPERTCTGCRRVFAKGEVVRIMATPAGVVPDYREKLPGRAAYVCPRRECIKSALSGDKLSRALRIRVSVPTAEDFTETLISAIKERIKSLVTMAAKAGKIVAGYSAVRDGLEKDSVSMIVFTDDLADGTREKILVSIKSVVHETFFTKEELGSMLGREAVGVIGFLDGGFSRAVGEEMKRLKGLLNAGR